MHTLTLDHSLVLAQHASIEKLNYCDSQNKQTNKKNRALYSQGFVTAWVSNLAVLQTIPPTP